MRRDPRSGRSPDASLNSQGDKRKLQIVLLVYKHLIKRLSKFTENIIEFEPEIFYRCDYSCFGMIL